MKKKIGMGSGPKKCDWDMPNYFIFLFFIAVTEQIRIV